MSASADAGLHDAAAPEPHAERTVLLAPSGAAVGPAAATVMTSANFRLVGSMSVSSGAAGASEGYELRSRALDLRH